MRRVRPMVGGGRWWRERGRQSRAEGRSRAPERAARRFKIAAVAAARHAPVAGWREPAAVSTVITAVGRLPGGVGQVFGDSRTIAHDLRGRRAIASGLRARAPTNRVARRLCRRHAIARGARSLTSRVARRLDARAPCASALADDRREQIVIAGMTETFRPAPLCRQLRRHLLGIEGPLV